MVSRSLEMIKKSSETNEKPLQTHFVVLASCIDRTYHKRKCLEPSLREVLTGRMWERRQPLLKLRIRSWLDLPHRRLQLFFCETSYNLPTISFSLSVHEGRAERPRLVTTNQALLSMMGYEPISRPIRGGHWLRGGRSLIFMQEKQKKNARKLQCTWLIEGLGGVSNQCASYEAGLEIFT